MKDPIKGFSKLSKAAKLEWLVNNNFEDNNNGLNKMIDGYFFKPFDEEKIQLTNRQFNSREN